MSKKKEIVDHENSTFYHNKLLAASKKLGQIIEARKKVGIYTFDLENIKKDIDNTIEFLECIKK